MSKIDIIQSDEFQKTLSECISRSIDRCIECGADYDENYLEVKWERRILDYWKTNTTFLSIMPILEKSFVF